MLLDVHSYGLKFIGHRDLDGVYEDGPWQLG